MAAGGLQHPEAQTRLLMRLVAAERYALILAETSFHYFSRWPKFITCFIASGYQSA
jgi:hypothetical protein